MHSENHSTTTDTLPAVLREATAGATPERALVIRELTAITALRFVDPTLYGSMVELGRIAEPNGPISVGLCQHCGAERPFRNVSWDNLTGDERRQLFLNPRVSPPRRRPS